MFQKIQSYADTEDAREQDQISRKSRQAAALEEYRKESIVPPNNTQPPVATSTRQSVAPQAGLLESYPWAAAPTQTRQAPAPTLYDFRKREFRDFYLEEERERERASH
jgi:hypothetical protein